MQDATKDARKSSISKKFAEKFCLACGGEMSPIADREFKNPRRRNVIWECHDCSRKRGQTEIIEG
jgi:uncharacterized protein with PIN domain